MRHLIAALSVTGTLAAAIALTVLAAAGRPPDRRQRPDRPGAPAPLLTGQALWDRYNGNAAAADAALTGRTVEVLTSGPILPDRHGGYALYGWVDDGRPGPVYEGVICRLRPGEGLRVKRGRRGIHVRGVCRGLVGDRVVLDDCTALDPTD